MPTDILNDPNTLLDALKQRTENAYLQRAVGFTGLRGDLHWDFDDMNGNWGNNQASMGWERIAPTNSGADTVGNNDEAAGVVQLTTGVTAASVMQHRRDGASIRRIDTGAWYLATRIKLTTAVTAQSILFSGMTNIAGNKTIALGFVGNLSAANYVVQYDGNEAGSILNLGVAVDTNWHIIEAYTNVGSLTTIRARLDGGAEVSAVQSAAPTDSMMLWQSAKNGTDAVARTIRIDWMACLAGRT